MIKFINPNHVPGTDTKPYIEIQDAKELQGVYSQLSAWLLQQSTVFETDGYVLRDTYASMDQGLQLLCLTTQLLNTQLNLDQAQCFGTFATKAALDGAVGMTVGQWARVLADETPVDFSGGVFGPDNHAGTPTYWGNIYKWNGTAWNLFANETKLYYCYYKPEGHLSILTDVYTGGEYTDLLDPYRIKMQVRFNNLANKTYEVGTSIPVTLNAVPEPNKSILVPIVVPNSMLGDLLFVHYAATGGPKSFVGLITEVQSTQTRVSVLTSELSAGGVQQYATFDDFPNPGLKEILYVDQSNQRAYTWDGDEYKEVTPDISVKADKFTVSQTTWNLVDVYNYAKQLREDFDTDHQALSDHIGNGAIHVTQLQKDTWNQDHTNLTAHVANLNVHFDTATQLDPTYDKIRKADLRDHLKTVNITQGVPDGAPHLTPEQKAKITAAAEKTYVDQELAEVRDDISDIQEVISGLSGLGRYLKTVDNYSVPAESGNTTLLAITYDELFAEFPGAQVNDFMNIRTDEQHNNSSARYILSGIDNINKILTWQFDVLLNQNLNFLMDAFADGDYEAGLIPTVTGQNTLSGKNNAIDPTTLGLKSELAAHVAATGTTQESIHISGVDRTKWDKAIDDLADHVDDENVHLQDGERTEWDGVVSDFASHNADNVRHITAAERTAWNAKASATALATEVSRATAAEEALGTRIDDIANKGYYIGAFDTDSQLPTNKGANLWFTGDWAIVKADNTVGGNITLYRISSITGNGAISWTRDNIWRNTAVDLTTYRRTLTVGGNWSGSDAIPDAVTTDPDSYIRINFAEEQASLYILASAGPSGAYLGGFIQYLNSQVAQRVGYAMNSQHDYSSWSGNEDPSRAVDMNSEDGKCGVFNFGSSATPLTKWVPMNDSYGSIYHAQEINEFQLSFPDTSGCCYIFRCWDTCKDPRADKNTKYVRGNKVTLFLEMRKAFAPDLDVSLDPSFKVISV